MKSHETTTFLWFFHTFTKGFRVKCQDEPLATRHLRVIVEVFREDIEFARYRHWVADPIDGILGFKVLFVDVYIIFTHMYLYLDCIYIYIYIYMYA